MGTPEVVFLTGATGLVGGEVLSRLLAARPSLRARVLVRDAGRWSAAAARLRIPPHRVEPVVGDLREPRLGIPPAVCGRLAAETTAVLHMAADITFSRTLTEARATNVDGTRRVLELASDWPEARRFAFVSTAFVAGRRTGRVLETDSGGGDGWVNTYEQSKWEAEQLVRSIRPDAAVFRSSTIACDSANGAISQVNAVHRALRVCYSGLAPMMPGTDSSPVDLVTASYVADAIARLALSASSAGQTYHLCAGAGAIPLGELLDISYRVWARAPAWKRRGVERPILSDLATYRLFEESVEEAGDPRLRRVMQSLSHFAPQLALEKRFDTTRADAALGAAAPPVAGYWESVVEHLLAVHWASAPRRAA